MKTILIKENSGIFTITINRILDGNSINEILMMELNEALAIAEKNPAIKIIAIEGKEGLFCTGMDFKEITNKEVVDTSSFSQYMETLKRISLLPKIIVSKVDGQVVAGGVGFVASSDYAIATSRSQFSLSEALWGLLPACVLPYLIRRVGFQIAYRMVLTTNIVSAEQACKDHLVDEVNENLDEALRKLYLRVSRLEEKTIHDLKQYFRKLWIIKGEMEQTAVTEITRLMKEPRTMENIHSFINQGIFPWEKRKAS
ncbi:polyketide biosynthesis enoyl-CoA hydratase PksH [Gammaproteobacteria bacterium]